MAANNRRQIVFDSRLPVGENTSINDPTHPRNIVLLAANTEAQGSADQRYDINPPPRVEGFMTFMSQPPKVLGRLPFLFNVFLVCMLLTAVFHIHHRIIKGILAVCIILILHTVISQFEHRCGVAATATAAPKAM
jgi:hypothetical protein